VLGLRWQAGLVQRGPAAHPGPAAHHPGGADRLRHGARGLEGHHAGPVAAEGPAVPGCGHGVPDAVHRHVVPVGHPAPAPALRVPPKQVSFFLYNASM